MTMFETQQRLDVGGAAPEFLRKLVSLDAAARNGLDPELAELVQIRSAQINNCAYCIDYHVTDARKAGQDDSRLFQLSAWREASVYTVRERAALALTEAVTRLPDGVPDHVYDEAAAHFTEPELARLIALIATANAWNRINVTSRKTPGTR